MKRIIDHFLQQWKTDSLRKPLLLRGARQVGKTYSVRQFGASFADFVEINLESQPKVRTIFEHDLDAHRILRELSIIAGKPIVPGSTLLFLDEIQAFPQAINALRYFYEVIPQLHVIAAGSLLDFAIEQVGVPVGRVDFMQMHPLSFMEYLIAVDEKLLIDELINHQPYAFSELIHEKLLRRLGEYCALGGMPQTVNYWVEKQEPFGCAKINSALLKAYRQDFAKYARKLQIKYVELIFSHIPMQLGRKFKYSIVEGDYRKRELVPALDLLVTACVAQKVLYSAGQGVPLGSQIDPQDYKVIFLDVGLAQTLLDLDISEWFLSPQTELINKGSLVESFVGQELLAYDDPQGFNNLYYWHKENRAEQSEVDYLISLHNQVIPIEVKAGSGTTLRSMHMFLETHQKSPYGIRFSTQQYSVHEKIHSYPLYAIAQVMCEKNNAMKQAINALIA